MGLCTNRVLMGQPLLALFISAKRRGSSPAPSRSASNDKRKKENGSSFDRCWHKPAAGSRAENVRPARISQTSTLFHYSRALLPRRRTLKCDEHGVRFFPFQEMTRLACLSRKNENRNLEGRPDI